MLHIGRVPAITDDHDQILRQVATDLVAANFDVLLPENVMPWKYRKLINNIGNVLGTDRPRNGIGPADRRCRGRGTPGARCGRNSLRARRKSPRRGRPFTMKPVPGIPRFVGGSSWQSLQRGTGNIERRTISTREIVMIAHRVGIEAPINERLAILARRAAATGAKPGDLSAEQLPDLLHGADGSLSAAVSHAAWDVGAVPGVHAMHSVKKLGTSLRELSIYVARPVRDSSQLAILGR
jgi:2-dehydropantoate 2-reductase